MRASTVVLVSWLLGAGVHAAPAPAPPLATLRADVDGDGRAEDAVLDAGGRLAIGAPGGAITTVVVAGPGEVLRAPASIVAVPDGKRALLVVTARAGDGERAAIVGGAARPEVLFSELLGPQGRDGEWSRRLVVDGDAILLGDERPGVARCDAPRALLHPRRFVAAPKPEFRAVSIAPTAPAGSSVITARAGGPAGLEGRRALVFRIEAASSVRGDGGTAEGLTIPRELDDGDPKTAWHEGRGGWGRGEFVTARARTRSGRLAVIGIVPGDAASASTWTAANRVKQLHVVLDDRTLVVDVPKELATAPQTAWITLPQPVATRCVSIVVAEVWPGREADHTAIGEITLLSDDELAQGGGLDALVDELARGGPGAGGARRVLVDAGPAGAAALAKKLAASTGGGDAPVRRRLAVALAEVGGAEHATALVRALAELPASATGDRDAIARGLARIGEPAVVELSHLLSEDDAVLEGRIAAAAVLGAIPGEGARVALTAIAGGATPGLTRAVIDALARRPVDEHAALLAAADAAGVSSTRVALLRALSKAPALGPDAAAEARTRALASAKDGPVSFRVAAADALGRLIDATSAALLAQLLDGAGPPEPRVAALAALPATVPAAVIVELQRALADRDPGVRAAALSAGGAALVDADPTRVHALLLRDHWPALRVAAARRLERRCDLATRGALWAAGERDPDDEVRLSSLGALVVCKDPGVGARLIALVKDDDLRATLRAGAARLIGPLADPRATAALADALGGLREDALAHPELGAAAVAAARSLGALGGPAALRALGAAVDDPADPGPQAAAIEAYAAQCPVGAARRIRRAADGAAPVVARAARLALERCAR